METLITREELNRRAHLLADRAQLFTSALHTLSLRGQPLPTDDKDAESELRQQCLELRAQIDQIKEDCANYPEIPCPDAENSPAAMVLHQRRLAAELAAWRMQQADVPSIRSSVISANTYQRLKESTEQLQTTLSTVRGQRVAVGRRLEREKQLLQESHQLKEALQKKNEQENGTEHTGRPGRDLQARVQAGEEACSSLRNSLAGFIDEYILQPKEEPKGGGATRRGRRRQTRQTTLDSMVEQRGGDVAEDEYPGLAEVVETLLKKAMDTPHDPYISASSVWQPHLQLLVRSGVVQRHPDNPALLRITPFHH